MGSGNDELAIWSYEAANTLNINPSTVFNTLGGDDLVTFYTIGAGELTVKGLYNLGAGNDFFSLENGVTVSGTLDGGADSDSFYLIEGSAKNVNGGSGNDFFTIRTNFNYSSSTLVLDGGTGEDNLTFDALTGSIKAEKLVNFESFNVGRFSKLNFTGNQLTIQNSTDPNSKPKPKPNSITYSYS